ncbi:MAG: sugar ABC transporter substrate-binding protein [Actinocatenispora sp.]
MLLRVGRRRGRGALGAVLAVLALAVTSCSNRVDAGGADPGAASGQVADHQLSFAVVSHGSAGDPFWTVVKNGAKQAGKDLDVHVSYQGSGAPQTQAQLIDAAVNQHVDGLIVSMANPDALKSSILRAEHAGIPVVTINSGQSESKKFGALTHVGQDETVAGRGAGARLRTSGVRHVLCVIHEAGNIALEQRCQGAKKGLGPGATLQTLQVDVNNLQNAQSTIQAKLSADPDIDGVLTLNPAVGTVAVTARDGADSKAKIATFDVSDEVTSAIRKGRILFAVDQQPYLQGYLPVQFLTLYANNANTVGGGEPVLTGPGFVTKQNAARVAKLAKRGTR